MYDSASGLVVKTEQKGVQVKERQLEYYICGPTSSSTTGAGTSKKDVGLLALILSCSSMYLITRTAGMQRLVKGNYVSSFRKRESSRGTPASSYYSVVQIIVKS